MSLLDFFKRKKKKPEKKKKPKPEAKPKKKAKKRKQTKKVKKGKSLAPRILKRPHVSEKTTRLAEKNRYVFEVYPKANKTEIKKAIEDVYGVDVLKVNIIKIPRKGRGFGRTEGFKSGYKKAIVRIKESQKIEII